MTGATLTTSRGELEHPGELSVDQSGLIAPGGKPNINRVGQDRLEESIGEGLAARPVKVRNDNGYFTGMTDLRNRFTLTFEEADRLGEAFAVSVPVLNVNQATEEQLTRLPGVTPDLASNIVNHRFTQREFRSVQGLYQVFRMTDETFKTLKPYLIVE